jgi:hypothetical protein
VLIHVVQVKKIVGFVEIVPDVDIAISMEEVVAFVGN